VEQPRRYVVERTFAWLGRYRRHSRDYERFTESSESLLKISSIHQMLNRLKPNPLKQPPFKYPKLQEKMPSREGAPGGPGMPGFGFPLPPLKFRTAGFPQYGFKWTVNGDLRRQPEA